MRVETGVLYGPVTLLVFTQHAAGWVLAFAVHLRKPGRVLRGIRENLTACHAMLAGSRRIDAACRRNPPAGRRLVAGSRNRRGEAAARLLGIRDSSTVPPMSTDTILRCGFAI